MLLHNEYKKLFHIALKNSKEEQLQYPLSKGLQS